MLQEDERRRRYQARVRAAVEVLTHFESRYEEFQLSESLIAHDEFFSLWRYHHVEMVERMLGAKRGTGGSEGVGYLKTTLGKKFFDTADAGPKVHPNIVPVKVAENGAIAPAGFAGGGPSASALFYLRNMQTFEDKKRSTTDAMNYSASVGLTAHLDQVLFPTPGPLHPDQILSNLDQYRMYDSWLALHREGKTIVRLQMNFLQNQNDPELPELKERLRNQFQFFGDDMMMTGSIGEWAAPLASGETWRRAQRLVAEAGWRNENSVQNLAGLTQVVDAYEAVNKEFNITNLRWVVHHVPVVTADLLEGLMTQLGLERVSVGHVR